MPYIKLLTVLAGLALLTACGGASPTAKGDSAQTTDCAANPFGASCIAEDIALPARITDCITAGNAGDTKCASLTSDAAMNTAINTCLTNPFDDSCTESDFTFSTYAEMARTNRVSFCETAGNETNALCSVDSGYADCIANPFATGCGAYFESAKNPYCGNNPTSTSCVNSAVWLASFTGNEALPTTPNTTRRNQFLEISATTTATTLFMTGSTTNGVAFFIESGSYYAGVLAGANLGAPITETITSARWTGQIRAVSDIDNAILRADMITNFGVDITFDATRETKGTIKETFAADSQFVYLIDGVFDENGIITGTVDYGAGTANDGINPTQFREFYSPGTLRGIIGQDGAVGVFHSDNDNTGRDQVSFSGGFVVGPPIANYATWLAKARNSDNMADLTIKPAGTADKDIDAAGTYLIAGGADAAALSNFNNPDPPTTANLTLSDLEGSDDANSGFSAVQVFQGSSYVYTGLLSDTDVGAPFTNANQPAAEWTAIAQSSNSPPSEPFTLDVVFTGGAGTIKTKEGARITLGRFQTTTINGQFGSNGVIYGSVVFNDSNSFITNNNGTLSGLIGVDGAVGVFINTGGISYGGGFVARPNN